MQYKMAIIFEQLHPYNIQIMIQYYLSKQYRRIYKELQSIDILSNEILIDYQQYNQYLQATLQVTNQISIHLHIFRQIQMTSYQIIKVLLFVHCYLQNVCVVEEKEEVLGFIGGLLNSAAEMIVKKKDFRSQCEKKILKNSKQAGFSQSDIIEEIQVTKQIFLLQNIIKPYVLYLQKLVYNFQFYNLLKRNLMKTLWKEEIWYLLNLFQNMNAVIINIPVMGKFIKKNFAPLTIALSHALCLDITKFYSKLSKYIKNLCCKIQRRFQNVNRRQKDNKNEQIYAPISQGITELIGIRQDIKNLNNKLQVLYSDPMINDNLNIDEPLFIDTENQQINFIVSLFRKDVTPKFREQKVQLGLKKEDEALWIGEEGKSQSIFSDITNVQDICTFRIKESHQKYKTKGNQMQKYIRWTTEN